jgi:hypothetical protein
MQNEAAAVYTRFTCRGSLSQCGAALGLYRTFLVYRRAHVPLEAAPPLARALGTSRAIRQ